jgi:hypothetical protein
MTSTKSAEAISPLRRRMIEDMSVRKFSAKTQHDYIRCVESFAKFLGRSPDTGPAAALLHRQPRLGAVKGLDLALFIDRQHQGLVGRIDVEADDILDFGDEVRIARDSPILARGRLRASRNNVAPCVSGAGPPWLLRSPRAAHRLAAIVWS